MPMLEPMIIFSREKRSTCSVQYISVVEKKSVCIEMVKDLNVCLISSCCNNP